MQAIRSLKFNQVLLAALASTTALCVAPAMAQTTSEPSSQSSEVVATEAATEAAPLTAEEASEMPSETPVESVPSTSEEIPSSAEELTPEVEPSASEETMPETAPEASAPVDTSTMTIADIASSSDTFEILTAALEAAELTDELSGEGPFTVFAPTDEAFEALPEGTLDALLLPENKDLLVQILTYHVVPEALLSGDIANQEITTLEGSDVAVTVEDGIQVNESNVLLADVQASNGIIHVIDQVMIPPELLANVAPAAEDEPAVSGTTKPSAEEMTPVEEPAASGTTESSAEEMTPATGSAVSGTAKPSAETEM